MLIEAVVSYLLLYFLALDSYCDEGEGFFSWDLFGDSFCSLVIILYKVIF